MTQIKYIMLIFTFTICQISLARTPIRTCSKKPLASTEKKRLLSLVKNSVTYKNILNLNASTTSVSISRCDLIEGSVEVSYILFKDILGKKCSFNSINFPFVVRDSKVVFKKLSTNDKIDTKSLDRMFLQTTLEKVGRSRIVTRFFKSNIFCQIEYRHSVNQSDLVIQLRNKDNKYCFVRSSLDGQKIEVIKRLYAKNSDCS